MKNILLFSTLILSITMWASCKKDDNAPAGSKNEFILNGTAYKVTKGFIEDYGPNGNGSYDFDVTLASESINYSDSNDEFSGMGDAIYFDLNSSNETGLVNGTYNYASSRGAFTLVDGLVGTNFNLATGTGEDFEIQGGSVDVSSEGNETILEWNVTISNGTTVTGEFRGILRRI